MIVKKQAMPKARSCGQGTGEFGILYTCKVQGCILKLRNGTGGRHERSF